jgi:hypothetical protein
MRKVKSKNWIAYSGRFTGSNPTDSALEKGAMQSNQAPLQTKWQNHAICCSHYVRSKNHRGLHTAPSVGHHSVSQEDRCRNPLYPAASSHRRQLHYPQASALTSWLRQHPRFHLHFTATSNSWLNMVEWWFCELTLR